MKTALLLFVVAQLALASGWRCESESESASFTVRLYNHTDPTLGTTNPSQFIVTENGETLVHRWAPDIDFLATQKGTTYRTTDTENAYGCVLGFHVAFREGVDSIPSGAQRVGRLLFTRCEDPEQEVEHRLICKRYLKNP